MDLELGLECVWKMPSILGESPAWVARENAVYWVDLFGRKAHRLGFADGSRKSWSFDAEVTCLAPRERGGFIGTTRHEVAFFDFEGDIATSRPIATVEADWPGNRFNDGKVDVHGRFWTGTMDADCKSDTGALYRVDPDLSVRKMDAPYICGNGPAFSADNRTLYHAETMKGAIYAFDFDPDGEIRNKRVFVHFPDPAAGRPDGMTVDSEGCLWVCHFGGGRVTRHSPRGELLVTMPLPVPNPTSCVFAGPDLDTLFITTATHGLSPEERRKHPLAGSLFRCVPGAKGLPMPLFGG
jgi:sugar lactone lactonase YvrE